jgi:lipopolysaccharide heptosyltransferase II
MNKITLLKSIDKVVGRLLVLLPGKNDRQQKPHVPMAGKILVIRPGGIGDAVLLLPVIHALQSIFPDSGIDILCEKRNADVFSFLKHINQIYLYDRDLELFKCLKNNYDIVIDTEQWHRLSAVVAYLTKAPIRIGFDTNERGKMFTHKIPYSHDDYEVYSFFNLLEPLFGESLDFNIDKPFIDSPISVSDPVLSACVEDNDINIGIFPGASVNERKWGGKKFGEVAQRLQEKGYKIIILGSKADRIDAEKIKTFADGSVDLTGKTTLRDIAAILMRCRLLITADSGIMHIAYAVGTPTVSLFGAGIEKKWAPRGQKHIVLNKYLQCSPCTKFGYTPGCPSGILCMQDIGIEDVLQAAHRLLKY